MRRFLREVPNEKYDQLTVIQCSCSPQQVQEAFTKSKRKRRKINLKEKIPSTIDEVNSEFREIIDDLKQRMKKESVVNEILDSIIIGGVMKYCPEKQKSELLKSRIIQEDSELWMNEDLVKEAKCKFQNLANRIIDPTETTKRQENENLSANKLVRARLISLRSSTSEQKLKSILVSTPKSRQKTRKVHFLPMKGEIVPDGAQIFDVEKAKRDAVRKSNERKKLMLIQAVIMMQYASRHEQNIVTSLGSTNARRTSMDDSTDILMQLRNRMISLPVPRKERRMSSPAPMSTSERVIACARKRKYGSQKTTLDVRK